MNELTALPAAATTAQILIFGAGQLASRLALALTASGVPHRIAERMPDRPSDCAGVVVVPDVVDRTFITRIASRCLAAGLHCLPVLAMGGVAQIGPLSRTDPVTACVACADLRMAAATGRSSLDATWPLSDELAQRLVPHVHALLGDWAAAQTAYQNRVTFLWSNGGQTHHDVMRTVACPVCGGYAPPMPFYAPARFELRPDALPDQGLILRQEKRLVDELTGPIRSVTQLEVPPDLPGIRHCVAKLVDPGWHRNGFAALDCGGNDLDPDAARAAALGEAIERASASAIWPGHLTVGSWRDLQGRALDPRSFDLFLRADRVRKGFPYAADDPDAALHWVWGTDLLRDAPVLIPAQKVFVPFAAPAPEPMLDYPLISGFAAGASRESALLSAMLEVIERDSFMIAWGNRMALQPVDTDDGGMLAALTEVFVSRGIATRVGLIQFDLGAPVAIAMARCDQSGRPSVVIAAAAAMQPVRACAKALAELSANWLNVHYAMATQAPPARADPALIRDETAHGLLYAQPAMVGALDFWWESAAQPLKFAHPDRGAVQPGRDCAALLRAMGAAGVTPHVVDLTAPAIAELGLFTLKCLVPGAYPMNFDALWPHLGGPRMREAPVRSGLRTAPTEEAALNRVPHPFP